MTLATKAALDALVTMVDGLTAVQTVYRGAPESLSHTLSAWVALGGQDVVSEEFGDLARAARYLVVFGYRVGTAEATAENALADAIDAFQTAFFTERKNRTGVFATGTTQVEDGELNAALADAPEYSIYAGQENRIYPMLVTLVQRQAE